MINDTLAIAEYLAERHPGLWRPVAPLRARGRGGDSGFGRFAVPADETTRPQCRGRRRYCESRISCQRYGAGGDFLSGSFCIADAMYAPVVSRLRYSVPVDPGSAAYMDAVWTHPWMQAWGEKAADEPRVEKYEDI